MSINVSSECIYGVMKSSSDLRSNTFVLRYTYVLNILLIYGILVGALLFDVLAFWY